MNDEEFYLNCVFFPLNYPNTSSLFFKTCPPIFSLTIQAIETYMPSLPNLHLTPFQSSNTIIDDINPLNYCLMTDDFIPLTLPNGQLLYTLDPTTGTSL